MRVKDDVDGFPLAKEMAIVIVGKGDRDRTINCGGVGMCAGSDAICNVVEKRIRVLLLVN